MSSISMHSRAYLLLEREFAEHEEARIFGITVVPVGDSLMEWVAEMEGLKDSLWEGADLQLSLRYTEEYNSIPPSITFNTIPFHPNVDPKTGRPCLDFLDDPTKWNTKFTMTGILLSIQVLLSNPVLENAVNLEAANLLKNNYPLYRKKVIQCVKGSQHLEAISLERSLSIFRHPQEDEEYDRERYVTSISFEEYYWTWYKLATSKAAEEFKSPVFEDPNFIGNRYGWRAQNVDKGQWDALTHRLIISEFIKNQKRERLVESKRSDHPLPSPTPASGSQKTSGRESKNMSQDEEQWEKEAEDLVMWSASLEHMKLD
ncbi:ubiquitin-conjugating enzyme E2 U [Lacerta agilis]|uniref:ubiquitin-conjugating enzyme E2 U n=1 Tax=Lacerta agilis TaxID=80427 RepID=UPI00141A3E7E|nr:ubiquitin-conjugating enzyme E2 U [Lacerta agilis]XP_033007782.1 ubiquitin-conjugating enzyme E2 U [Lacerta agilis]XP_033007783.1 ubiquitin-conjugating enzyme E2 U [Lacerta agilis]